ncbi:MULTISPECIES: carbohydrate ABC transporter permease [Nesterenkonia]|uniref:Multiple sugar transport system permease protein n=1 Tax=Nesterenkonia xinjiangensis TaxID=225327 RepID=A0A7Z0K8W8_9MICC|nr:MULTISPECIES: carbohydrate ABC transporter permease [Nesterenkonia]MDZ5076895.1 carbohydrate ABC transporter permease [Nesterenkonia sp. HG001]NYJ77103.1 multiple sugar transport system permease protein [Nesterenkonia xinjiangensis]
MSTTVSTVTEPVAPEGPTRRPDRPARRRRPRRRSGRGFGTLSPSGIALRYALLLFVLVITIGPFLWQFSTSLRGPGEDVYSREISFIPQEPTLDNYLRVTDAIPVFGFIMNSVIVAALAVGGNVLFATLAGFALARLRFKGRVVLIGALLGTLVLPGEATIIAQYLTIRGMGLSDTLLGVALPGMVAVLNVLLMYNAFRQIPPEIDLAAVVDGAGVWRRLWNVALPSAKGTIAVVAIFSFIGAWNDFLWPLIALTTPSNYTLTVGLQFLAGTFVNDQRLIAAGAMIAFIPIAIVFAVLQRYFFRGIEEGGVKG